MKRWRGEKRPGTLPVAWLRSLRPPSLPLNGHLRLYIPVDAGTAQADRLSLSSGLLAVGFAVYKDRLRIETGTRIWDIADGEELVRTDLTRFSAPDPLRSPDERLVISIGGEEGGWDQPVRILESASGAAMATFTILSDQNMCTAAFSPDGRLVAAGGYGIDFEGYVHIWNVPSRSPVASMQPEWPVWAVAFSPRANEVLIGSSHGALEIWDIATYPCGQPLMLTTSSPS